MLRKLVKYTFRALVLLLVFLAAALLAMRFAIQGREVKVPRLTGLTPSEAERVANSDGLVLSVESRFYSPAVPEGRIVSQAPAPDAPVRRGWKVRVAESLGPQRAAVPNLIGQSEHAAGINISRRGLEIGTVATVHVPGAQPDTVVSQNPSPNATEAASPRVGLLFSAADNAQLYVMPNFVGKSVAETSTAVLKAGFTIGKVREVTATADNNSSVAVAGTIVRQYPPAGQRIAAGAAISFDVGK
ncbi:MAG TPA: PASTA domain-containing protein [Candidatus Angelobacter sp.]|nr:PASTA domain-containing protein [Candidatus Angelobacter sp.]